TLEDRIRLKAVAADGELARLSTGGVVVDGDLNRRVAEHAVTLDDHGAARRRVGEEGEALSKRGRLLDFPSDAGRGLRLASAQREDADCQRGGDDETRGNEDGLARSTALNAEGNRRSGDGGGRFLERRRPHALAARRQRVETHRGSRILSSSRVVA